MKPDLYTKAVLTVIAACLVVLTIMQLRLPSAEAQQAGRQDVNVASIGGETVQVDQNSGVIFWVPTKLSGGRPLAQKSLPFVLRNQ